MIEVKTLSSERWKEARELRLLSLKTDPSAFGSAYEEEENFSETEWRRRTGNMLVALTEEDRLVGMITYVFSDRAKSRHIAHIYGFYVSQDYRGRGIGRKLLERALKEIRGNKGIAKIQLMVNTRQEAAVALYRSFGFTITGEMKRELKIGEEYHDEYVMEMLL